MHQPISRSLAVVLWAILVSCAYNLVTDPRLPAGPAVADEYPYDQTAGMDIRLADFDGDGRMDSYSVRCERCPKLSVNGCPGGRRYMHYVIITRGGSNLTEALRAPVFGAYDDPIEATGWDTASGNLALKHGGKWHVVPWTKPKGERDFLEGQSPSHRQ